MSEFCYECYKKYFDEKAKKESLVISEDLNLCEGGGHYKTIVIRIKRNFISDILKNCLKKT